MRITTARVRDFKGVHDVTINPPADSYLLLIGGENDAGKTSTFDGILSALGGKAMLPAEAVRRGADKAVIDLELDGGTYRIERTVPKDGEPTLKVTGPDGRISRPQEWLAKLIGHCFLDPLKLLIAKPDEQRALVARLVGLDLDAFKAERKALYDDRSAIGKVLTSAAAELGRLPAATPRPAEARSQAAIRDDQDALEAERRAIDAKRANLDKLCTERAGWTSRAERLRADIARLQAELGGIEDRLTAGEPLLRIAEDDVATHASEFRAGVLDGQRAKLREESTKAETLARWEAAHEALASRRRAAEEQVSRHGAERDRLTAAIEAVDARKSAALAVAAMPVEGLGISDDGLTLDGFPFEQASHSAQMRCAIAITMAMQPGLQDILIRDGSLIGEARLALLAGEAMFAGCRLWIERVGEKDEGAIIIRDGRVAGAVGAG
jgi:DNA repair exonuclease SbcCD ATPase subunit